MSTRAQAPAVPRLNLRVKNYRALHSGFHQRGFIFRR